VNTEAYEASQALDDWLGDSIASSSIARKELCHIKPILEKTSAMVEEILDSEEEDEDFLDCTQLSSQTQVISASANPPLPELLEPRQSSLSPSMFTDTIESSPCS